MKKKSLLAISLSFVIVLTVVLGSLVYMRISDKPLDATVEVSSGVIEDREKTPAPAALDNIKRMSVTFYL